MSWELLQKADAAVENDRPKLALDMLLPHLGSLPPAQDAEAFVLCAKSMFLLKEFTEAADLASQGLARHPHEINLLGVRLSALIELGLYERAHRDIAIALESAPEEDIYHYLAAITYFRELNIYASSKEIELALVMNPQDADYHAHHALVLAAQEQSDEARAAAERALAIAPANSQALTVLSILTDKRAEKKGWLQSALLTDPTNKDLQLDLKVTIFQRPIIIAVFLLLTLANLACRLLLPLESFEMVYDSGGLAVLFLTGIVGADKRSWVFLFMLVNLVIGFVDPVNLPDSFGGWVDLLVPLPFFALLYCLVAKGIREYFMAFWHMAENTWDGFTAHVRHGTLGHKMGELAFSRTNLAHAVGALLSPLLPLGMHLDMPELCWGPIVSIIIVGWVTRFRKKWVLVANALFYLTMMLFFNGLTVGWELGALGAGLSMLVAFVLYMPMATLVTIEARATGE